MAWGVVLNIAWTCGSVADSLDFWFVSDKELAAVGQAHNPSGRLSGSHMNVVPFKSRRASAQAGNEAVINKGMVLPFEPLCLTFRHVNYYRPYASGKLLSLFPISVSHLFERYRIPWFPLKSSAFSNATKPKLDLGMLLNHTSRLLALRKKCECKFQFFLVGDV